MHCVLSVICHFCISIYLLDITATHNAPWLHHEGRKFLYMVTNPQLSYIMENCSMVTSTWPHLKTCCTRDAPKQLTWVKLDLPVYDDWRHEQRVEERRRSISPPVPIFSRVLPRGRGDRQHIQRRVETLKTGGRADSDRDEPRKHRRYKSQTFSTQTTLYTEAPKPTSHT